jgi:hypothetical protein
MLLSQTTSKQILVTLTLPKAFSPLLSSPHFESRAVGQTFEPTPPKALGHGNNSKSAKQGKMIMAKFYVQSGSVRAIVDSLDMDRAALWVVNEVMTATLPIDDMSDDEATVEGADRIEGQYLSETIKISEQGFDRDDACEVDVLNAFRHWYELYQAVSILAGKLGTPEESVCRS